MKYLLTIAAFGIIFVSVSQAYAADTQSLDTFQPPPITDGVIDSGHGFVPCSGVHCSPCDLVVMFNTIVKWVMMMVFILFAVLAVKAGLTMVTSGSPGALAAAKKSFTNAFLGLLIMLAAWLIVDTLLRKLLDGGNLDAVYSGYGPWSQVQCASDTQAGLTVGFFEADPNWNPGDMMSPATNVPYTGGSLSQCKNGACSTAVLTSAGMTAQQAAAMSCIALTESSGNSSLPPYYQTHPKSSACGTFQIIKKTWESNATGNCASFSMCTNAACNAQVAATLVKKVGYTPWTCPGCNNKASACVSQYGK